MDQLLSFRKVKELTGLSRPTIWRREREGLFPKRRLLSGNRVGWLASEVEAWVRNRPQAA